MPVAYQLSQTCRSECSSQGTVQNDLKKKGRVQAQMVRLCTIIEWLLQYALTFARGEVSQRIMEIQTRTTRSGTVAIALIGAVETWMPWIAFQSVLRHAKAILTWRGSFDSQAKIWTQWKRVWSDFRITPLRKKHDDDVEQGSDWDGMRSGKSKW